MAAHEGLEAEVGHFRRWMAQPGNEDRSGDWEALYPRWQALWAAATETVAQPSISDDEAELLLFAIARDREEELIIERLRNLGAHNLITVSRRAIGYPDFDARRQVVDSLDGAAGDEATALLKRFAEDPHAAIRRQALALVARRDCPYAEERAREQLKDADPFTRMASVRLLVDIGSDYVEEAFTMLRDDPDAGVRRSVEALEALVRGSS